MKKEPSKRGRRPDPDSALKRKERQRKYFKAYNAVRKARYQSDPEYRAKIIEREREKYREATGVTPRGFGDNAGAAKDFASQKKLIVGERFVTALVLSIDEMSTFLNVTPKILNHWIRTEKFPDTSKKSKCGKRVFTLKEANALAKILRDDLSGRSAFRPTDTVTIEKLFNTYESLQ
jgi:hypothetical protein